MHHTYTFFDDPGHAWLQIPIDLVRELGVAARISRCSYVDGHFVYLEEDCDAPLVIRALVARGDTVAFEERFYEDIFIRGLAFWSG